MIFYQDLDYNIIWTNHSIQAKMNYASNELKDKKCYEVWHNKDKPCEYCPVPETINNKKMHKSEISFDDKKYIIKSFPVEKNGEIKNIIIFRLEIDNELNNTNKKINSLENFFLANLSHEIKTPLNLISSSVQLLKKKIKDENKTPISKLQYLKYINIISHNNQRLMKTLNNLLDLTMIESKNYHLHLENCDIISLIKETTYSVKKYIKKEDKKILFYSDLNERTISCDPFNIKRIVLNILSNAIKFTNPLDIIYVKITNNKDSIIIKILDTGHGIPFEKQDKIFQKFYQLDKSFSRSNEGNGMGLAISRALVNLHHGKIKIKSNPGKGSEFTIVLPVNIKKKEDYPGKKSKINENNIDPINIELSDLNI